MQHVSYSLNGKIWVFVQKHILGVISDSDQQLTLQDGKVFVTALVYAKCDVLERLTQWEDIYSVRQNLNLSWFVGGDFNVILGAEEKIEGLPVYPNEYEDFAFCINSCDLLDIIF